MWNSFLRWLFFKMIIPQEPPPPLSANRAWSTQWQFVPIEPPAPHLGECHRALAPTHQLINPSQQSQLTLCRWWQGWPKHPASQFIENLKSFSDASASLAPSRSIVWSVTLSDFHCVGVSGALQSIRRPRDIIYFPTAAMTNSFHTYGFNFPKVYILKCAWHILSFQKFIQTQIKDSTVQFTLKYFTSEKWDLFQALSWEGRVWFNPGLGGWGFKGWLVQEDSKVPQHLQVQVQVQVEHLPIKRSHPRPLITHPVQLLLPTPCSLR